MFDPNNPSDVPTSKPPTDVLEWLQEMKIVAPPSPAEVMRQYFQTAHEKDLIIIEQLERAVKALRERGEQAPSGTES